MTKLDRATAALTSGQRYRMNGRWYTFFALADRALAHPEDWDLEGLTGALWADGPSENPAYLVVWNGGSVDPIGEMERPTHRSLHLLHETRHARGSYVAPWYDCDGAACGMINL